MYDLGMAMNSELDTPLLTEIEVSQVFAELKIDGRDKEAIKNYLEPLKQKDIKSYEHCLRVGLLARKIAQHQGVSEKALFFSGLLHDLGKVNIPSELLKKTGTWTKEDYQQMKEHVMAGYNKIKGRFDFSAEIVLLHHRFQDGRYPENLPEHLHPYSEETQKIILEYGRILALADVYDALHRKNSKFGEEKSLTDEEIREKMLSGNADRVDLVNELYEAGIFY